MMKLILLCILLIPTLAYSASEADHVKAWCPGEIEYVLEDSTRVDCLTDEYAIEFDWDYKWAESIGQSLHYSLMTGKKAGVVLIIDDNSINYINRLLGVASQHGIRVWLMRNLNVSE